jgi:hypothetical protein
MMNTVKARTGSVCADEDSARGKKRTPIAKKAINIMGIGLRKAMVSTA